MLAHTVVAEIALANQTTHQTYTHESYSILSSLVKKVNCERLPGPNQLIYLKYVCQYLNTQVFTVSSSETQGPTPLHTHQYNSASTAEYSTGCSWLLIRSHSHRRAVLFGVSVSRPSLHMHLVTHYHLRQLAHQLKE